MAWNGSEKLLVTEHTTSFVPSISEDVKEAQSQHSPKIWELLNRAALPTMEIIFSLSRQLLKCHTVDNEATKTYLALVFLHISLALVFIF